MLELDCYAARTLGVVFLMILNARSQSGVIEPGAIFRRRGNGAVVEIAHVQEIAADKMGIPHVRYRLKVMRGNYMPFVEERTLALDVFQSRYRERIQE